MRSIERLPEDIHNSVRSGVVICDFSRVVEELVFNSLDASATKVYVAVGVGSCCVKVVDNGSGIVRDDLVLLGERYATSKAGHMSETDEGTESLYSRGEALCSISYVSVLEVVTKARAKPHGYKKIIKNCKCMFLGINDDIEDMGTTVTARDIFYNQPVRRKHMKSSPQKVLDLIKMSVLKIALVHVNVCFKVVDMECNHELLRTGPSSSPLPILFSNFGVESSLDFHHLNKSDGPVKLSGYISGPRETLSPKAVQYFYVNSRFICKGPIHKLLNQLAANFDLSNSWKPTTDSLLEKQNRCHLIPTFILNLNCPRSYYDLVNSDRSRTSVEFKDWIAILNFVETGVKSLWMKNIPHDVAITCGTEIKQPMKQNCQTSLGLNTPQLNKTLNSYEDISEWEGWISPSGLPSSSELDKHQGEVNFLYDTDYTSRSCKGLLANHRVAVDTQSSTRLSPSSGFSPSDHQISAYTSGKQWSRRSYAALPGILPKFEDNTSMQSGVSADGLDIDVDIGLGLKSPNLSLSGVSSPGDHHVVAYTYGRQHSRSYTAPLDILPEFKNNTSMGGGVTAHGHDFDSDICIRHYPKKSIIRSCSAQNSLPHGTPPSFTERFRHLGSNRVADHMQHGQVSYQTLTLPGILPKFEDNTSMQSGVSADDVDFGIDIDVDIRQGLMSLHSSPPDVLSRGDHRFMAYTSGKQHCRSYAAPLDILPKVDNNTSMQGGITVHGRDFGSDIGVQHDPKKSILRSCSARRNLPHRTSPSHDERFEIANDDIAVRHCPQKSILRSCSVLKSLHDKAPVSGDERFELKNGDCRVKMKSVSFDESVDDVKYISFQKELQIERSPPFQLPRRNQFDVVERSKVLLEDMAGPSSVYKNMVFDSPAPVQKLRPSQQYLSPGWSHITENQKTVIRFREDDVGDGNLFENYSELGEDTSDSYSNWREDGIMDTNLDMIESRQQQDSSSADLLLYPKGCSYSKRKIGEFNCGDFEDSLSPYPSKRPREIDWSPSPSYGEERSKDYLIPTSYKSTSMEYECEKVNGGNLIPNKRKHSVRSHSAPPLYRGKNIYSRSSDFSSILPAKANAQSISGTFPCTEADSMNHTQLLAEARSVNSQKSADKYKSSPIERLDVDSSFAERLTSGGTPEVIKNRSSGSQNNQLIVESVVCLDSKESRDPFNPGVKWRNNCSPAAGPDRNTSFNYKVQDHILDISSDLLCVSGDPLVPKSIEKTSLDHAKVLSQVDKKFIAVVAGKTLAVIDQHAADERIRLEELRHKVLSGEMKTITYLDDERELVLPEVGYQLLHNYADQIRAWGWICNIHSDDTTSFAKNIGFLHRHPSVVKLLGVPCILGVSLTDNDLLEFLQQLADTDGSSTVPQSVYYILNSKACRGAIMFGDTLLPSECSLIVDELKRTSLCFQCAHGRPTMVPLVNLDVLHSKIEKLAPSKSWHGLRQHKLTLERTTSRLSSAR